MYMKVLSYIIISIGIVLAIGLIIVLMSPYLPSHKDAKAGLVYSNFRLIRSGIEQYWIDSGGVLPNSLGSISQMGIDKSHLRDPFKYRWSPLSMKVTERQLFLWSVGPDGIDSFNYQNANIQMIDEIVMVAEVKDATLSFRLFGQISESIGQLEQDNRDRRY